MLKIRAGVVIHIDYAIKHMGKTGEVKGEYKFIHNEIQSSQFPIYGKDYVSAELAYGVSGNDTEHPGVILPVIRHSIKNRFAESTYYKDRTRLTLASVVKLNSGIVDTGDAEVTLRELGLTDLSRLRLEDASQGIPDGIVITSGDSLETTLTFMYTFYTNDLVTEIEQVGNDEPNYYSSELITLPDFSVYDIDNSCGYNHPNKLNIYAIDYDITGLDVSEIDLPRSSEYQDRAVTVDPKACRIDLMVQEYTPTEKHIYGYVMRIGLQGVGLLVRLTRPLVMDAEHRYKVAGLLSWGATAEDIDDGYTSVELENRVESLLLGMLPSDVEITRPIPSNDVAVQINSLTAMQLVLADGSKVNIPKGTTIAELRNKLQEFGLDVELYSNRVDTVTPSTMAFIRPDDVVHTQLSARYADDPTVIKPIIAVGGNYTDSTGLVENSWRWDSYYPYIGGAKKYLGYAIASIKKAKDTLTTMQLALPGAIVSKIDTYVNGTAQPIRTEELTASELLATSTVGVSNDQVFTRSYLWEEVVDPSVTNVGYTYRIESDYDSTAYRDWVKGNTNIQSNMVFLNLVPATVENPPDVTTEFKIVIDTAKHDTTAGSVWVDDQYIGTMTEETFLSLADSHGISVVKQVTGTKTSYTLTKPYVTANKVTSNIFIFGNHKALPRVDETAYVKIVKGKSGFKVYNKTGSDISNNLYLEENPFLALGVTLSQPVPDYVFRYKIFTAAEAARNLNTVVDSTLNENLFTIDFNNSTYNVQYANTLDSKSPLLDGASIYPAIGFDTGEIDPLVDNDEIIMRDFDNVSWTKGDLLNLKISSPERFIGNVLWFVFPTRLTKGSNITSRSLVSSYYGDSITANIATNVVLSYTIDSVAIDPAEKELFVGAQTQLLMKHTPSEASVSSVTWASLDSTVAIVDSSGLVTAVGAGTTTIRTLVNALHIATARITVIDPNLNISCELAKNPGSPMILTGTQLGLKVNDEEVATSSSAEVLYNYFRTGTDGKTSVINYTANAPYEPEGLSQTEYMTIEGLTDLWVGGVLYGKDLTPEQVLEMLENDPRLTILHVED